MWLVYISLLYFVLNSDFKKHIFKHTRALTRPGLISVGQRVDTLIKTRVQVSVSIIFKRGTEKQDQLSQVAVACWPRPPSWKRMYIVISLLKEVKKRLKNEIIDLETIADSGQMDWFKLMIKPRPHITDRQPAAVWRRVDKAERGVRTKKIVCLIRIKFTEIGLQFSFGRSIRNRSLVGILGCQSSQSRRRDNNHVDKIKPIG